MSWEDKFTSIVKETESNLARVRDRLGSSKVRSSTGRVNFNTSPTRDSSHFQATSGLSTSMDNLPKTTSMFSSPFKTSISPSKSLIDLGSTHHCLSSPTRALGSSQPGSNSSPALLNMLYDKIEQQSEMLESLSKTVKMLKKERNTQAEMISSLQSQVVQLNDRLKEQGVDLETERKLEQFKREMYSYLQTIQAQYRLNDKDNSSHGDPNTASLAREIQENKRLAQDDCESLRREVDHVKTRISKIELDTNSTLADARDSARRLDRIDRTVSILSENQRSQSHSLESMVDDRDMRSFELGGLRQKINDLSKQVSEWESDSQGQSLLHRNSRPLSGKSINSSKTKNQTKHKKKETRINGHASATTAKKSMSKPSAKDLDVSLSDNDLDMSSAALLAIDSDSDSDLTSIQINTNSLRVDTNPEISDLSSSLSSLNSDELLGL